MIWDKLFLGNPLKDWAIAVGFIVAVFMLINLLKKPALKRLQKWTASTANAFDDFIILTLETTIIPLLYFITVYLALQYLEFDTKAERVLKVAILFVSTFYLLRLATSFISYIVTSFIGREEGNESKQKQARGLILVLKGVIWILGIVFLLNNSGYDVTTLIAGLGIGGIAIALAAQTILGDLFSYFVIFFDRPFEIGDFIIVEDKIGTVEYIGIKTTRIKSISGEQIVFSNKDLTDSRLHNFKRMQRRRVIFKTGVTYQTSSDLLKKIPVMIKEIVGSKENADFDRSHFSEFGDFSLNFETIYFINSNDYNIYMDVQQKIYIEILERFKKENIEFAYPTQTLFAGNSFTIKKEIAEEQASANKP
ncbi:MAG: mechanosensitive ion channel family protein [Saprospiraceae bacterium]|nr:mechanosensitive ion channel family protein [Saprospiraceae bacterium]